MLDRMATKNNLLKKGVLISRKECPLCLTYDENLDHIMALCSSNREVSAYLASWENWWPRRVDSAHDIFDADQRFGTGVSPQEGV